MNFKISTYSWFIFLVFTIVACKDETEYRVDNEFEEYVIRFETEASARGRNFDLKSTGLIVEFADLKNDQAGLCHYEKPIRIEIDKKYWTAIGKSAGADAMKEDLLFHELGHGILNRRHLNTTLENGDWKSMMCGGEKIDDRPWNINYRGIRRHYYLDELFNESTPAPDFSSIHLFADTTGFARKVFLNFDTEDKKDAGWTIGDSTNYKISIDNQRLRFDSKVSQTFLVFANTGINVQNDFKFELTIDKESAKTSDQYGIVWGVNNSTMNTIEYFTINKNGRMYMGNRGWYSFYTEIARSEISTTLPNKLKVVKIGEMLYYFINDVYAYSTEMEMKETGNDFGFIVPANGTVWLDNMTIAVNESVGVKQNIKSIDNINELQWKVIEINDFEKVLRY